MGRREGLTAGAGALAGGERAAALLAVRVLRAHAGDELVAAARGGERGRELVARLDADGDCGHDQHLADGNCGCASTHP
jgi:hypothetical protein